MHTVDIVIREPDFSPEDILVGSDMGRRLTHIGGYQPSVPGLFDMDPRRVCNRPQHRLHRQALGENSGRVHKRHVEPDQGGEARCADARRNHQPVEGESSATRGHVAKTALLEHDFIDFARVHHERATRPGAFEKYIGRKRGIDMTTESGIGGKVEIAGESGEIGGLKPPDRVIHGLIGLDSFLELVIPIRITRARLPAEKTAPRHFKRAGKFTVEIARRPILRPLRRIRRGVRWRR